MGITDFFSAAWDTFALPSADAEAPPQGGTSTQTPASGTDEESSEEAEVNKQDAKSGESDEQGHRPSDGGDDEDEAEEEEEDEDELVDPKETLEEGEFSELWRWTIPASLDIQDASTHLMSN
jgi:ubiquinol-cytochrome c reductase subunit 6